MSEKTYYYLKLEETYFNQKIEKALRQMPSGAEMLICYLKMQLKYIASEGFIIYSGIYDVIEKEIALEIDESEDIVKLTLTALIKWGYINQVENGLYLKDVQKRIGSKTDAALRMEKHREKIKLLENNSCNNVTNSYKKVTQYRVREELEKDIDKIKEIIAYLNLKANKNYKHNTDKTIKFIKARLNENWNIDDFKKVIDNKCLQWLNDINMNKYLRPETLFGTKFEGYLNENIIQNRPIDPNDLYALQEAGLLND